MAYFLKQDPQFKNKKNTKTNLLLATVHVVFAIRHMSNSHNNLTPLLGGAVFLTPSPDIQKYP
jgi:hypothetical protein